MARFIGGCLLIAALVVIGIPLGIMAILFFQSIPRDISTEARFSEIYNKTFDVQDQLFIKQWSDSKEYYLEVHDSSRTIAIIEPGTRLQINKITVSHGFATTNVRFVSDIDDPSLSKYKTVDASHLLINVNNANFTKGLSLFDPQYLKNIEINSLHNAVLYKDFDAIKRLVENGADVNQRNVGQKSPLHYTRQAEITEYLLGKGADPDASDEIDRTALHYATKENNLELTKLLIDNGASIDPKDYKGDTPLLLAAEYKHFDIVTFLLESGADVQAKGDREMTVLLHAAQHNNLDIVRLCLQMGADPAALCGSTKMSCVLFAARNNNLEMAKLFVEAGALVNTANDLGYTPLHYACGNLNLLKYLCENGADVNRRDHHGDSVLHKACGYSDVEVVRYLCEQGADIHLAGRDGLTPLDIAIKNNHKSISRVLKRFDNNRNR